MECDLCQVIRNLAGHTGGLRWGLDVLNANEQTIVSGSTGDRTIKIWRWSTGECLNTINTNVSIQTLIVLNPTAATIESNIYTQLYAILSSYRESKNLILDSRNRLLFFEGNHIFGITFADVGTL
jgi:WD40 repeat protein